MKSELQQLEDEREALRVRQPILLESMRNELGEEYTDRLAQHNFMSNYECCLTRRINRLKASLHAAENADTLPASTS